MQGTFFTVCTFFPLSFCCSTSVGTDDDDDDVLLFFFFLFLFLLIFFLLIFYHELILCVFAALGLSFFPFFSLVCKAEVLDSFV